MDILATPLRREIDEVRNGPQPPIAVKWEVVVHCGNEDIKPIYVDEINWSRNYTLGLSEEMQVSVMMGEGDFNYVVFPNKQNLEISLRRIPLAAVAEFLKNENTQINIVRAKAQLYDTHSGLVEGSKPGVNDRQTANRMNLIPVKFQVIDVLTDYLRKISIGGTFHEGTGADMIHALLGQFSSDSAVPAGGGFKGVDIAPNYNPKVFQNVIVPDHTPLLNIPAIIDIECGGIYSTGFWYHYQNGYWYVYPIYDTDRYNKTARTLNIINIPENRYPEPEKSYRISGDDLIVLATGQTMQIDTSEREQLTKGNATRFVNPEALFDEYMSVEGNKVTASRAKVLSEVTLDPRADNRNFTTLSETPITAKAFREYSKLAFRSGTVIQAVWENSDPELIYPGMPVKYTFLNGANQIEDMIGVVVGTQSRSYPNTTNIVDRKFLTKTAISIFVGRKIPRGAG